MKRFKVQRSTSASPNSEHRTAKRVSRHDELCVFIRYRRAQAYAITS
jgi:hypothetical protein